MKIPLAIEWIPPETGGLIPGRVRILDQTRLPLEERYIDADDLESVWHAIRTLQVRGAPAIGIAAAMALVLAVQRLDADPPSLLAAVSVSADRLRTSRPTAVNLFWALDRMQAAAASAGDLPAEAFKTRLAQEAIAIRNEDAAKCRAIGRHAATLIEDEHSILTHCNAGSLATAERGTALAPIYQAAEDGKRVHVFVDETRPLLQGSRLTAWELQRSGIPVTLICDNMAAQVMREGRVNAVFVGADRIAANGDTANKIGTYGLAILSRAHGIPFYVLAPTTTIDSACENGSHIPIEERGPGEVVRGFGTQTAPEDIEVYSPAFDVTPAEFISGIVCEEGIARPDYSESLRTFLGNSA